MQYPLAQAHRQSLPARCDAGRNVNRMQFMRSRFLVLCAALAVGCARAEGDVTVGQALYTARCTACHSLDYNGVGPRHKGLIGRKAGSAPGFAYSDALKNAGVIWNEATLARWLADPEKFIPGQKMFISIPDAQERADLIAYLLQAAR
jgi:cytochrome c